jgi:hypothetical protein
MYAPQVRRKGKTNSSGGDGSESGEAILKEEDPIECVVSTQILTALC